jgi:MFS family permease
VLGAGATLMCLAPNLAVMAAGLVLVGVGGGPLYPLAVDRLYHRAESHVDAVGLGAIAALASGTAVVLGPLVLGVASDIVELRWAILLVTALAIVGAITQRPAR